VPLVTVVSPRTYRTVYQTLCPKDGLVRSANGAKAFNFRLR
jgi:hypothetical protein